MAVKIVSDTTMTGITPEQIKAHDIRLVTLFIVDGDTSTPEITMDMEAYNDRISDLETLPKTSQPSPEDFRSTFLEVLEAGDDVLGIFVSGGLSATIENAHMVKNQLIDEFPHYRNRIAIVDSMANAAALAFPVLEAADAAAQRASLEQCREIAEYASSCTRFLFAPRSLEHLHRGGRIGRASFMLGTALKMVPILGPDKISGTVHTYAKIRTYPKALLTIKDKMLEDAEASGGLKALCVHYISELSVAEEYYKDVVVPAVKDAYPEVKALFSPVSPTIATHVGPAVGIAYQCANPLRKENESGIGVA